MNIIKHYNMPVSAIYVITYIGIVALFAYEKFKPVEVEVQPPNSTDP
jgi:hypothetical protein